MFVNLCRLVRAGVHPARDTDSPADGGNTIAHRVGSYNSRCDFEPLLDVKIKERRATVLIPGARTRYLAEIDEQGRANNRRIESQADIADRAPSDHDVLRDLGDPQLPKATAPYSAEIERAHD